MVVAVCWITCAGFFQATYGGSAFSAAGAGVAGAACASASRPSAAAATRPAPASRLRLVGSGLLSMACLLCCRASIGQRPARVTRSCHYLTPASNCMTMAGMPAPHRPVAAAHVKALRGFNRFYTSRIGVLDPYLGSDFSLTEVRVLYELAHRDQPTASELARDMQLDAGYLSRILR